MINLKFLSFLTNVKFVHQSLYIYILFFKKNVWEKNKMNKNNGILIKYLLKNIRFFIKKLKLFKYFVIKYKY